MTHLIAIGGSDAGISAALRARELDPTVDVTVVVADEYPNFSICGIPYYFTGEVAPWRSLAHRTAAELEATGMGLRLNTYATGIDVAGQKLTVRNPDGSSEELAYDELVVGTGALPSHAGITGLDTLGPDDGVHVIHSMGDTFALDRFLDGRQPSSAIIVGAGYVGLEMAEAFTVRGLRVIQLQRGPEVLSTLDPELGALVHAELAGQGVEVVTNTTVTGIEKGSAGLTVTAHQDGQPIQRTADLVLVVVGVRPNTELLERAGASLGAGRAVVVDEHMRTGLSHVWAAGDGIVTHHRLLGVTYLPLGTTAHKQGRVAGENAIGGDARFAGSVGTQVVKVFDLVAARTGLHDRDSIAAGYSPMTTAAAAAAPRSPSASTPTPPPSTPGSPSSRSATSTSPTPRLSALRGTPCRSPPKRGRSRQGASFLPSPRSSRRCLSRGKRHGQCKWGRSEDHSGISDATTTSATFRVREGPARLRGRPCS